MIFFFILLALVVGAQIAEFYIPPIDWMCNAHIYIVPVIVFYGAMAGIMHGLRPLFIRGRWEVHCILSGICTSAIILAQYLMITFRRGSVFFSREVWWQIGGPGLMAMLMAPLIFWTLQGVARLTRYPYLPERGHFE